MPFGLWDSWLVLVLLLLIWSIFFLRLSFCFTPTLFLRIWDVLVFPDFLCQKTSNSCNILRTYTLRSHSVALVYSYNIFLDYSWSTVTIYFCKVTVLEFLPMCISNCESLVPACGVKFSVLISSATSDASI